MTQVDITKVGIRPLRLCGISVGASESHALRLVRLDGSRRCDGVAIIIGRHARL